MKKRNERTGATKKHTWVGRELTCPACLYGFQLGVSDPVEARCIFPNCQLANRRGVCPRHFIVMCSKCGTQIEFVATSVWWPNKVLVAKQGKGAAR